MNKFIVIIFLIAAMPFTASARTHVSVGVGYGGYAPYYPAYAEPYPYYPAYSYYPAPRSVYVEPAPVIVQQVNPYGTYARQAEPPVGAYDNGYCREYSQNVIINNHVQKAYGTTCRQPDGTWQIETPAQ